MRLSFALDFFTENCSLFFKMILLPVDALETYPRFFGYEAFRTNLVSLHGASVVSVF